MRTGVKSLARRGVAGLEARMPPIDPYGSNRVMRLIRYLAGQDEVLIRCVAQ